MSVDAFPGSLTSTFLQENQRFGAFVSSVHAVGIIVAVGNVGTELSVTLVRTFLHPTPCTLHPTPYTLHPTLYNLHPTRYTLHATPYTLQPTPHTPHPTPNTFR